MSENPTNDSFMNDHPREANELFTSGSDHQDYNQHPWPESSIDYHNNESEANTNNIPGISGDFNFTSGEENNVITPDIDNFSVSNNSPAREMTFESSNVNNNTSNISSNSSAGSNVTAPNLDASHEESTNTSLDNEGYFDQPINQIDRAYFENYYSYITPQSTLSNGNPTRTYVVTLPTTNNSASRIDPSLLTYEQNVPVQGSSSYAQSTYANNSVPVNNNSVSNYWNDVQTQISRGLSSNYYNTIPSTNSYEQFAQQITGNGRSLVADAMSDYMTLNDHTLTNKGKKKRGRKSESDYSHVIPLPSPSSTDGNRQEIAQCSNCGVRDTPAWRRDLQGVALLCNACGL
ncbi:6084_t:CDS:1 [Acaulospora colombiana]|uniref:6084_t:CDS:1 n=1 Tax=Acaulospora colombiana TaxID=27376 RepID=A0ACA9KCD1_9GLOM|nr:6084_t:CDS:1 [Acaulospora colombiana]